jgi:hypothetical protein
VRDWATAHGKPYDPHARRLCRIGGCSEVLRMVHHCVRPRAHPHFHMLASPRVTTATIINAATAHAAFAAHAPPL